ncbi:uncharacterized protein LOC122498289 [Leptopilina heterotoma]|uniref:uncharacterized protein LOC122498289 n=1 Tax=Leptopilina heterotoma TaxID=63436 RepID=UPI001CA7F358|nr:uncharacterized protein LOC122498289 [Leptopilina heterotoma]
MNSEGENFPSNKRRRYKMILDPNCDPALQLSQKTLKTWIEASEKIINQIRLRSSLETCTSEVHLDELLHSTGIENEYREYSETDEEIIDYYEEASDSEDEQDMDPNLQSPSTPTAESSYTNTSMFNQGEEIMFDNSGTTVNDVIQMIVAYSVRFGSTHQQRDWMLEMFKICAGSRFDHIKLSNYQISKVCDPPPDKIVYHFYCDQCLQKKKS